MNSNKVLFLCGHYAFPSAANSICVQNLAEEAVKQGFEAFVLARGCEYNDSYEEMNGVKVWKYYGDSYSRVVAHFENKRDLFSKVLFKTIHYLRYMLVLWIYPITSLRDYVFLYKRANLLLAEKSIDTVVATYGPYETVQVAIRLKKKYKDRIKVVSYHLDLLTNPSNESKLVSKLKQFKAQKSIKKEFQIVDRVLVPMTAPRINSPKVHYVDFPLYVINNEESVNNTCSYFPKDSINIAIAGSLDIYNRNPLLFCNIIENLPQVNNKRVVLHIWGKATGISFDNFRYVKYHGMADVEEVSNILRQSDFLLNVGNKNSYRMLPSKIFQIFAAKKPIFFLYSSPQDRSIPYFEKYGFTFFVFENNGNTQTNIGEVESFIKMYYNCAIDVDDSLFERSTPSYIVHKLLYT